MATDKDLYGADPQNEGNRLKDDVFDLLNGQSGTADRNGCDDSRATTDLDFPDIPVRKGK